MVPDDLLTLCRILQDASSAFLWGTYAYLTMLVPTGLAEVIERRLAALRVSSVSITAITTFGVLPVEAASLGDGWESAFDIVTIQNILIDTNLGQAWLAQAFAAIALVISSWFLSRRRFAALALCAGLLLGCRGLTGHSVMGSEPFAELLQLSYLVHVLSAGAWLGALVPLILIFQEGNWKNHHQASIVALHQFSAAGQVVVVLVLCTGMVNTALVLGHLPMAWSQPYDRLLAIKILLVAGMILIALINRFFITPRIKSGSAVAARQLRYTTVGELALGLGALVLVNVFSTFDPG